MGGEVAGLLSTPTRAGTPDTRGLAASHPWLQLPGTSRVLTTRGAELPLPTGVQVCLSVPKATIYRQYTDNTQTGHSVNSGRTKTTMNKKVGNTSWGTRHTTA